MHRWSACPLAIGMLLVHFDSRRFVLWQLSWRRRSIAPIHLLVLFLFDQKLYQKVCFHCQATSLRRRVLMGAVMMDSCGMNAERYFTIPNKHSRDWPSCGVGMFDIAVIFLTGMTGADHNISQIVVMADTWLKCNWIYYLNYCSRKVMWWSQVTGGCLGGNTVGTHLLGLSATYIDNNDN